VEHPWNIVDPDPPDLVERELFAVAAPTFAFLVAVAAAAAADHAA